MDIPIFFKDVPNFVNDVPNFVNDVPNFVEDVPFKVHFEVRNNLRSLFEGVQMNKWTIGREIGAPLAQGLDVTNFLKDVPRVPKSVSK